MADDQRAVGHVRTEGEGTMGQVISGTYTSGIRLTNTLSNPVTVTSTGNVNSTGVSDYAIYGAKIGAWTLSNYGTPVGGSPARYGIVFAYGGTVVNGNSSFIGGGGVGVVIENGAGSVSNPGTISGIVTGVELYSGGTVDNLAGGLIAGHH
jgi:hypothetical protein